MPDPNSFFTRIGIWPKWKFPSSAALKVLEHLAWPGNPRLYMHERADGIVEVSTSNSAHSPGSRTMIDPEPLIRGGFVELEEARMAQGRTKIEIYRITDTGREVLAQAAFRTEFERVLARTAQRALNKHRKTYGLKT